MEPEEVPIEAEAVDSPPDDRVYSAPRRFDIATMLVVTVAYALLMGAMRVLKFDPYLLCNCAVSRGCLGYECD